MRTAIIGIIAAAVLVSGCTGLFGGDGGPEETDQEAEDQDMTRTQDYAGASGNFTSASQRIDYTGNNEVAANPNNPGETATFAAMARVPTNEDGNRFRDLQITADYPAFSQVRQGDVRNLILDRGVNNTIKSPGSEDLRFNTYRTQVSEGGNVLTIEPGTVRDYEMTTDDRVLVELTSFRTPEEAGDRTVEVEVNSETTDTIFEPVRTSLEIRN